MCSLEATMSGCSLETTMSGCNNMNFTEAVFSVYKREIIRLLPESLAPIVYILPSFDYHPWVFSVMGSILIGLSGVLPMFIINIDDGANLKTGAGARTLRVLLSFAVGCLLGDVFLHLLPEVWTLQRVDEMDSTEHPSKLKGLWVLAGLLIFIVVEKVFSAPPATDVQEVASETISVVPFPKTKDIEYVQTLNNNIKEPPNGYKITENLYKQVEPQKLSEIKVSGYLNLMANSFDNFTHGLAVGGSFMVSFPNGLLTTIAILLHEIPHEVSDFAILLKSGFSRWDAARAQLVTATTGILGALTSVVLSGATNTVEAKTSWILPFTAGGFLHIALVTVLPDLLREENPRESLLQSAFIMAGIIVMGGLVFISE